MQTAPTVKIAPALHQGRSFIARLADLAGLMSTRLTCARSRQADSGAFDVTLGKDPGSRDRAADLLDRYSNLSGQTHALSDDPWRFLWAKDRCAFLPFHELAFTLIAWRDPVGPAEASTGLIERFRALAAKRGKHAVLLGVSGSTMDGLRDGMFRSVWIGTEPFYDLGAWHTHGKAGMKVRLACNHAQRLGAAAREAHPLQDARAREAITYARESLFEREAVAAGSLAKVCDAGGMYCQ